MPTDRSTLPSDAIAHHWGAGPTTRYDALAARFRPVFARIRAGSVEREIERRLPTEEIEWLRRAGFTALRVPHSSDASGASGVTLPELFALLVELSEADSNLTQALRAHFGFVEHALAKPPARRDVWLNRLAEGQIVGAAWSETGDAKQANFSTVLSHGGNGWRLNGTKFYTTGSLYADWIHVGASDAEGAPVSVTIERKARGVEVLDDWDGMGQRLTASGTSRFIDVPVDENEIVADGPPFAYSEAFYQLVHLATLAGIGRALASDVATALATRKRGYSHAAAPLPANDPQLLEIAGRLRANAYSAGAIVQLAAVALERAAAFSGQTTDDALLAVTQAELEIWQAQTVVSQLVLDATTDAFDALGASATLRSAGLDRYWRNARTITSHNPRVYKDRIVGDFAVNGKLPPGQWRIGQVDGVGSAD